MPCVPTTFLAAAMSISHSTSRWADSDAASVSNPDKPLHDTRSRSTSSASWHPEPLTSTTARHRTPLVHRTLRPPRVSVELDRGAQGPIFLCEKCVHANEALLKTPAGPVSRERRASMHDTTGESSSGYKKRFSSSSASLAFMDYRKSSNVDSHHSTDTRNSYATFDSGFFDVFRPGKRRSQRTEGEEGLDTSLRDPGIVRPRQTSNEPRTPKTFSWSSRAQIPEPYDAHIFARARRKTLESTHLRPESSSLASIDIHIQPASPKPPASQLDENLPPPVHYTASSSSRSDVSSTTTSRSLRRTKAMRDIRAETVK
ncbi:hypothetical protein CYLTODRAFT_424973 [Cylindrobasidium torrendii FP15055 ss-10]|uniref:Uncharacterized protein n=1 Tax=Cylindrobasidium torrendii FP15055 ss-10 TaxID=1314674 RepID=A0A0D7B2A4_9AGAR|nr:hypothetical protein CYLTODRAFT_424973 [Cylindrobasidium torrendii FP15055 ss-10]